MKKFILYFMLTCCFITVGCSNRHIAVQKGLIPNSASIVGVVAPCENRELPCTQNSGFAYIEYILDSTTFKYMIIPQNANTQVNVYPVTFMQKIVIQKNSVLFSHQLAQNEVFVVGMNLPETLPKIAICLQTAKEESCWIPRYNGESEALLLDEGFIETSCDSLQ